MAGSVSGGVAILGTGLMGLPMAANLARAGLRVSAWNRTIAKAEPLARLGVRLCATAAEAVTGAEVVLIMLSNGAVVDAALADIADALSPGTTVVVMSSIPVEAARAQAAALAARGIGYVDAPVSGGTRGAEAGTLVILAGGGAAEIDRLAPIFAPLGRVTRVGPVGSGQLAKLANQLIVGVTIGAVAEALILAEAGGADPAAVRAALLGGFADSTILRQHGARMVERDFAPGAHATTQLKDLMTVASLARSLKLDLPFATLAQHEFAAMCETARGALDHSALYLAIGERRRAD